MSGLFLQHKILKPVIIFWRKSRSLSVTLISFPQFPEQGYTVSVSACSILCAENIRYLHILSKDMEPPSYSHTYKPLSHNSHLLHKHQIVHLLWHCTQLTCKSSSNNSQPSLNLWHYSNKLETETACVIWCFLRYWQRLVSGIWCHLDW